MCMKGGIVGFVWVLGMVFWSLKGNAQDLQYSQFFANQLDLNPAFAGSQYYHRVIVNYRNQWPELGHPYVTYSFSYDRHLYKTNSGVGVQIQQDRQGNGALLTTTVTGIYSYLIRLKRDAGIRMALGASLVQNHIDLSRMNFPDMIDPIYGSIYSHDGSEDPVTRKKVAADFSCGLLGFFNKYHFGVAIQHLAEPSLAFSDDARLPMKYSVHAGAEFPITKNGLHPVNYTINPLFLFQKQASHIQMNYGAFFNRNDILMGAWFRQNFDRPMNAVIVMAGYDCRVFRIAYSFDWTLSKLNTVGNGSHEVSFIFLLGERENRGKRQMRKPIPCPRFYRKNEMRIGGQRNVF